MNEKGRKSTSPLSGKFPGRGLPSSAPPPPPAPALFPPLFGLSYLFVFGGSHFSSSPLPGLEVREETNAGSCPAGCLTLPRGCGRPGGGFQPPSAGPGGRQCTLSSQPSGRDHRGVLYTEHITRMYCKAEPDSSPIAPNGTLEIDSLKLEVFRNF